jgi:hypothetical protein
MTSCALINDGGLACIARQTRHYLTHVIANGLGHISDDGIRSVVMMLMS